MKPRSASTTNPVACTVPALAVSNERTRLTLIETTAGSAALIVLFQSLSSRASSEPVSLGSQSALDASCSSPSSATNAFAAAAASRGRSWVCSASPPAEGRSLPKAQSRPVVGRLTSAA
eukprot:scaffold150935_cov32-Tisochrysis_lutea.AAC.1